MGRIIRLSLFLIGCSYFLSLTGCDLNAGGVIDPGEDLNPGDDIEHSARDELIPDATSLSEGLPNRTASKVTATIPMTDLDGFDITLTAVPDISCFDDISKLEWSGLYMMSDQKLKCVDDDGTVPPTVTAYFSKGNTLTFKPYTLKNPIKQKPVYLQFSYYYNRVAQYQLTKDTSKTVSSEWTYGMDTTKAQSFTHTLGVSATVEAGGNWGAFSASASATVSEEFSSTTTYSTTISESTTQTESNTFAPTDDGTYLYGIWQKVEVFQFVDENGDPWEVEDLGYEFAEQPGSNGDIFGFESKLPRKSVDIITTDIFYE